MSTRRQYLEYIQQGYANEESRVEEEISNWKKQFPPNNPLFGYWVTKFPLHYAVVSAFLYEQTGDRSLAWKARDTILRYREFAKLYPPEVAKKRPEYVDGVPPLDCAFDPIILAPACERMRPAISDAEYAELGQLAADSLQIIWKFPEWGGHNRAMLRAASLAVCARAFPFRKEVKDWLAMADELAEESWGRWSIEDAMMYQSHWLRALILYAEARNKPEIADFLQPRLHIKSMTQLISPIGILPDYGDSHWLMHSAWEWLSLLEWGARTYRDPAMKWAAGRIWQAQQTERPSMYAAMVLGLAWRWCDDQVIAQPPHSTPDALDDLVLKKLVFRTGWDEKAAYALVNYRDEGDYGKVARDYLRTNLAVSAEKMHHGHSDEGSFAMLVHQGAILLHESGYRESPPDGIYRADIYHNRLVWRPRVRMPGVELWDFLQDNGHYKPVRTERLYQTQVCGVDIRRIRTNDEIQGLFWDRSIFFLPDLPAWVVVDSALSQKTLPRTFSLLWWTTNILAEGNRWFKTHIDEIHGWKNSRASALTIYLPEIVGQKMTVETCQTRRDFQNEILISNTWSGEHRAGRSINFVTVLVPHPLEQTLTDAEMQVSTVPSMPTGRGMMVRLNWRGEEYALGTLNDLTVGYLQEDIRPRYTAEQGWCEYGEWGSDAAFIVARARKDRRQAGFINGTRFEFRKQVLFQQPLHAMFQEDRSDLPGVAARFRWQGENYVGNT